MINIAPGTMIGQPVRIGYGTSILNRLEDLDPETARLARREPCKIGDRVSIGAMCTIYGGTVIEEGATIEDGAIIGELCTIKAGCTIGAGSVIGACVTVSGDVPPGTVYPTSGICLTMPVERLTDEVT